MDSSTNRESPDQSPQSPQSPKILLKVDKRRYDGGPEIELIEYLEAKRAQKEAQTLIEGSSQAAVADHQMALNLPIQHASKPQSGLTQATTETYSADSTTSMSSPLKGLLLIMLAGPLTICAGLLGIVSTSVAYCMFALRQNRPMAMYSKKVMGDCLQAVRHGVVETLYTPAKLVGLLMPKKR